MPRPIFRKGIVMDVKGRRGTRGRVDANQATEGSAQKRQGPSFAVWMTRASELDDRVFGPSVDDRPLGQRLMRPRSAVVTRRGRAIAAVILIAMAAAAWRLPDPLGVIVVVALFAALMGVWALDWRWKQNEERSKS